MKIILSYPEQLTKLERYQLTRNNDVSIKDNEGTLITPVAWCMFEQEDEKNPDKVRTVLSIKDIDGSIYTTISKTFADEFLTIVDICEGSKFTISVIKGLTKAGREFVTCNLVSVDE